MKTPQAPLTVLLLSVAALATAGPNIRPPDIPKKAAAKTSSRESAVCGQGKVREAVVEALVTAIHAHEHRLVRNGAKGEADAKTFICKQLPQASMSARSARGGGAVKGAEGGCPPVTVGKEGLRSSFSGASAPLLPRAILESGGEEGRAFRIEEKGGAYVLLPNRAGVAGEPVTQTEFHAALGRAVERHAEEEEDKPHAIQAVPTPGGSCVTCRGDEGAAKSNLHPVGGSAVTP